MIRRPPRSTLSSSSAASDVYKRQEYYTATKFRPVKAIAKASETGAGTNIIAGLAMGFESTLFPVLVICAGILISYNIVGGGELGLYSIAIAASAMLSTTGIIVCLLYTSPS